MGLHPENVPYGYCHCGCGERTRISLKTCRAKGWVKGEPLRYLNNHSQRCQSPPLATYYAITSEGCWEWTKMRGSDGYGRLLRKPKLWLAHRWVYEQLVGPIPEGLQIDHLCRNRACVNPAHLEPVTNAENTQRGRSANLTAEQVRWVRKNDSIADAALAKFLRVSVDSIRNIKSGRTWKNVEAVVG